MTDTKSFPLLFSPVKIGNLELKNRLMMSPVGTRLARDGIVTDAFTQFYAARARGGVGLIVLEPCFVEPEGEGMFLSLHEDRFITGLRELVDTVHVCGAKIGVQLYHAGWQSGKRNARFLPPILPAELSVERIEDLVRKFTEVAGRAQDAGFDLIEIHAAHGYLLSQFLSPLGNQRTDEYGLDITGRTRFVTEIIQSIRERVGHDFPLSCRINGAENISGGLTIDDAKEIAPLLVQEGLDLLSASAGALGSYPLTIPPSDTEQGCYVHLAEGIKQAVDVPVVAVGRINSPELAEEILKTGKADLIAMSRGLVADPELPSKSMQGQTGRIRKCIACNACLDNDYEGHIACTVNAEAGRETELQLVSIGERKKVLIIGAGLAGLEAARIASLRGHNVTLCEEKEYLGGQWVIAACPLHKKEFMSLVEWLSAEIALQRVEVQLGRTVTAEMIGEMKPDVVIVATGAVPLIPPISGFDREEVVHAWEALLGNVAVGDRVLVVGGGATGLETAVCLAERGKKVSVVEMLKMFGSDMGGTVYYHLRFQLKKLGVELHKGIEIKEINDQGVVVENDGQEETWKGFDTIVLALGVKSRNEIVDEIRNKVRELYVIGDAATTGRAVDAIRQGYETGMRT
ncbi:MAG: FAD-dependent oxidoreductase [Chloroflexi bacterium]|nr:FAD-dependent oxidoreductase [Chloroflexota bacterium]